jgi:hypothetical protein
MKQVTFWKFVSHPISTTQEQAKVLAERIQSGEYRPPNSHGERFYKLGGYCYDVGRKAYLIQYAYGSIERKWAHSVAELRKACYLKAQDKVVLDPFQKGEIALKLAA